MLSWITALTLNSVFLRLFKEFLKFFIYFYVYQSCKLIFLVFWGVFNICKDYQSYKREFFQKY